MKTNEILNGATDAIPFLLLLILPLAGILGAGYPLPLYLEFPPVSHYVRHTDYSWSGFAIFTILALLFFVPIARHLLRCRRLPPSEGNRPFPWWGWLGLALTAATWLVAWTRFEIFDPLQTFTFSPLWFGYILGVNALTYRRTGRSMMTHQPRYFLLLFAASSVFWWFFEYLNRFVQNWYYLGVDGLTPLQYFLFATLPFSTVLPAVLGTYELLQSFWNPPTETRAFCVFSTARSRLLPWGVFLVSSISLAVIGLFPNQLFPLLWISPLLVLGAWEALRGRDSILFNVTPDKWHAMCLLAVAALICGFFWEMWNYHSLAKWIYAVPYVNRFHIFEMPLLGYTGYLPFGLECALIGKLVERQPS